MRRGGDVPGPLAAATDTAGSGATDRSADAELVDRLRRGDPEAYETLVRTHSGRLLSVARRFLPNEQDAQDAVQDAFIRVHDNLARFRDDAPFDPWFFRILGNRCRTIADKRQRHRNVIDYSVPLPDAAADPETPDVPDEALTREVYRALADLPADQREAFLLRHVNDMDYEEMTIVTGARGSTLRMRVKRAVDALRVRLREGAIHE